jgi:hypothetical protein
MRRAVVAAAAVLVLLPGCARLGNPAGPGETGYRLVSTLPIEGYAEDIEVSGDICLIAADEGGLVTVDVSDPTHPVWLGAGPTAYKATGCAYAPTDRFGYVTDGSLGALVYDLADPASPEEVTYCQGTRTRDIVVREVTPGLLHRIYGADGEGDFRIWELRYYPSYDAWFSNEIEHAFTSGNANGICLDGDLALLAMEEIGLTIFDVSDPANAVEIGHVDTPGEARAVAASGDHAYVADWRRGLEVVDISDPASPRIVGSYDTDGNAVGVFVRGGKVYVADHADGLLVFDVSVPDDPRLVGSCPTPFANGVWVTDAYVFVADRDWGLAVFEEE